MNKKNKLRVVIDTNVVISSFWGGNPEKIILLCKKRSFSTLISEQILFEVSRVLIRTFGACATVDDMISLLKKVAEEITPLTHFDAIPEDPSDNMFLDCAVEGKADFIISGNTKHLGKLKSFQNIPILTPRQFLDQFHA